MKTWPERIGRTGRRESEGSAVPRIRRRSRKSAEASGENDPGRLLQSPSALMTFLGITLGVFVSRKFFVVPLAVVVTLGQELLKDGLIRARAGR